MEHEGCVALKQFAEARVRAWARGGGGGEALLSSRRFLTSAPATPGTSATRKDRRPPVARASPDRGLDGFLTWTCLSFVLAASCGNTKAGTGKPPLAVAGADQIVNAGTLVTLDGSRSSDPDGDAIVFSWAQTLGTIVSLSSASASIVTFVAPVNGTSLRFGLTVSDGRSASAAKVNVSVHPVDPMVRITEIHQPSVNDDPAVTGHFPDAFTLTSPLVGGSGDSDDTGAPDGVENFAYAPTVEIALSPGASQKSEFQVIGPALLIGMVRWIGTIAPLSTTLSLDGISLGVGRPYSIGTDRGGSVVRTRTTTGGRAALSVTNMSKTSVKARLILGAFAL